LNSGNFSQEHFALPIICSALYSLTLERGGVKNCGTGNEKCAQSFLLAECDEKEAESGREKQKAKGN
jgi:hypothetical protein